MKEKVSLNPSLWEAQRVQQKLAELGGCSRLITDLDQVFSHSLLGERLGRPPADFVLTGAEKRVRENGGQILVLTDLDGVLVSPAEVAWKFLTHPQKWSGGWDLLKEEGKIPFSSLSWFFHLLRTADKTILWTSRFCNEVGWAQSPVDYFPFLGLTAVERLEEQIGRDKLRVEIGKSGGRADRLAEYIENKKGDKLWDLVYYVGSSHLDRRAVLRLGKKEKLLLLKLIFFDTGHLVL